MPGRVRLSLPGIPWHIIQRGNNRSACFYADEDYQRYLDTLKEQADKFSCLVHAYVLMTNHVHLLLTPEKEDSAPFLMKHLGQRYVQYINRTYKRSGNNRGQTTFKTSRNNRGQTTFKKVISIYDVI